MQWNIEYSVFLLYLGIWVFGKFLFFSFFIFLYLSLSLIAFNCNTGQPLWGAAYTLLYYIIYSIYSLLLLKWASNIIQPTNQAFFSEKRQY